MLVGTLPLMRTALAPTMGRPAGMATLCTTFWACPGPLFVVVRKYCNGWAAAAEAGPTIVVLRSAVRALLSVIWVLATLSAGTGSAVAAATLLVGVI